MRVLLDESVPRKLARELGGHEVRTVTELIIDTIEGFTYHREWQRGNELALEFTGRVGELELQGIDLITLDGRFAIGKLDVLMRPIRAIAALQEIVALQMAAFLARPNPHGGERK